MFSPCTVYSTVVLLLPLLELRSSALENVVTLRHRCLACSWKIHTSAYLFMLSKSSYHKGKFNFPLVFHVLPFLTPCWSTSFFWFSHLWLYFLSVKIPFCFLIYLNSQTFWTLLSYLLLSVLFLLSVWHCLQGRDCRPFYLPLRLCFLVTQVLPKYYISVNIVLLPQHGIIVLAYFLSPSFCGTNQPVNCIFCFFFFLFSWIFTILSLEHIVWNTTESCFIFYKTK